MAPPKQGWSRRPGHKLKQSERPYCSLEERRNCEPGQLMEAASVHNVREPYGPPGPHDGGPTTSTTVTQENVLPISTTVLPKS